MESTARRIRSVNITPIETTIRHGSDGVVYLSSPQALGPYPDRITDRLEHWAREAPGRVFLAQRDLTGGWRTLTYADAFDGVGRISQSLLNRKLSPERPILILSGNGIDHALLALAAMHVGVPYAPIAPAYSLQARDYGTLQQIFQRLKPGLVFAAEGAAFERALAQVLPAGVELVVSSSSPATIASTPFSDLLATSGTGSVNEARNLVGPDTIAKILFTSGSTGHPKGVINTQRMLCSNQEMIRTVMAFLADEPPTLCCWLPWNHTAGGNHNFGIVLYNGGTFYIDEGKPTPGLFDVTLRNLREIPAIAHFTVPRTYEMLLPHLRSDAVLRETFFKKLKLYFYAAAGLGQRFWDELRDLAIDACGEELLIVTGFGATETAPFALTTGGYGAVSGMIGLPCPGMELKLAPAGSKKEARVRGPNITPGYWGDEAMTRAAFDEEGFYKLGDAMDFVDPADPNRGLMFNGRLAEDFKLSTGTWVSVGPLRSKILMQAAGLAQDVVIAGHDRDFAAAMVFPNLARCRELAGSVSPDAPASEVLRHPAVVSRFQTIFDELARQATGSSTFVSRAVLLDVPPSLDAREITDKGSINQRAVLRNRAALVDDIYSTPPPAHVIVSGAGSAQRTR
ncbi:MAG TPA: feruloyl-CoA synthase [Vicinamibacterales bacterium]|nr:feruloyl-CoA synthase [Vicinamibacterales bacterium]